MITIFGALFIFTLTFIQVDRQNQSLERKTSSEDIDPMSVNLENRQEVSQAYEKLFFGGRRVEAADLIERAEKARRNNEIPFNKVTALNVGGIKPYRFWELQELLRSNGKVGQAKTLLEKYDSSQFEVSDRIHFYQGMAEILSGDEFDSVLARNPVFFDGAELDENAMAMHGVIANMNNAAAYPDGSDLLKNLRKMYEPIVGSEWRTNFIGINTDGTLVNSVNNNQTEAVEKKESVAVVAKNAESGYLGFKNTCFYGKVDEISLKDYCQSVLDVFTGKFKTANFENNTEYDYKPDPYINCELNFDVKLLAKKITKFEKLVSGNYPESGRSTLTFSWSERKGKKDVAKETKVSLAEALVFAIDNCKPEVLEDSLATEAMKLFNLDFSVFTEHLNGPIDKFIEKGENSIPNVVDDTPAVKGAF